MRSRARSTLRMRTLTVWPRKKRLTTSSDSDFLCATTGTHPARACAAGRGQIHSNPPDARRLVSVHRTHPVSRTGTSALSPLKKRTTQP